jgi:hypothetical protein
MRLIPEDYYFGESFPATLEQKDCIPPETETIPYLAEIGICRFGKPGILQVSPAVSVYPHPGKAHGDGGSVRTHCQNPSLWWSRAYFFTPILMRHQAAVPFTAP